ncbi:MAG: shikimate dehydrogenase [Candidatus Paracaedibacteraceae bacterium]|nr:shikimate dehydrogenase [Candidatus Paracaedibacteraceae bacterium]
MKLALFGQNISYSLSPKIHQTWMKQYGLEGSYEIYDCLEDGLPRAFDLFDGGNVTIPHKVNVLQLIDALTPLAEHVGAVNTIYKDQGKWVGDNTDAMALLEMIPESMSRIVVLGRGGAARAVKAVGDLRGQDVFFISRDQWENRHRLIADADMLINATPLGLMGEGCPVDFLPDQEFLVMDMVYNPRQTPLLNLACERGHKVLDGVEMLYRQARHSFNRWWGILPAFELTACEDKHTNENKPKSNQA